MRKKREKRMERGRRNEEKMKREKERVTGGVPYVCIHTLSSIQYLISYKCLCVYFIWFSILLIHSAFSFFLCCADIWMLNILRSTPVALILSPADLFYKTLQVEENSTMSLTACPITHSLLLCTAG